MFCRLQLLPHAMEQNASKQGRTGTHENTDYGRPDKKSSE
jgi:hypothetical protein